MEIKRIAYIAITSSLLTSSSTKFPTNITHSNPHISHLCQKTTNLIGNLINSTFLPDINYMERGDTVYMIVYENTIRWQKIMKNIINNDSDFELLGRDPDFGCIFGKPYYKNENSI